MLLSLKERYQVMGLLPQETSRKTGKLVRKLMDELLPGEEEIKKYQIKEAGEFFIFPKTANRPPVLVPQGQVMWDTTIEDVPKEIEIGEIMKAEITKRFKEMDGQNRLPVQLGDLFDRFMEE